MFIDTIRISNFENPMGMALEPLTVSWKVREALRKRAENICLSVAMNPAMQNVILKKSGAALYLAGFLMFPIFGFNMVTFILTQLLYCMGAAFAFESILKVWMQECFPTLLRTTANGAIVFSSRLCCAAFGLFTASIISFNVKFAFILLALFCVIGFASAILVFRKRRYNTFEEEEAAEVAEVTEAK